MIENCVLYILEIIKYYLVMKNIMGYKEREGNSAKIFTLLIIILFSYYITNTSGNPAFAFIIFVLVEIVLIFEDKLWKKILAGMWLIFFIAMLDEMFQMFFELAEWDWKIPEFIDDTVTVVFICVIVCFIKIKTKGRKIQFTYAYYLFLTLLSFTEGLMIESLQRFYKQLEYSKSAYILVMLSLFIMIINVVVVIFLAVSNDGYKQRDIINQEYLKQQERHYKYLKELNEDIRRFKHDYTSHMINIRKYSNEKTYDELNAYVDRITEEMHMNEKRISVNNGIVDAILNQYAYEAETCGVKFEVFGHFEEKPVIEPYDLCVVFSNLIKNAMAAAKESEEKYVHIYIGRNEDEIKFKVENSYGGVLLKENGKYSTTKEDKINHGLGIENVKRSLNKYDGNIFFDDEKNVFRVIIEIKHT